MELLSNLKSVSRQAFVLLLLGLVLRIAFIVIQQRPPISDERDYHQLAVTLASTGSYTNNGIPTACRPPIYPVVVGLIYYFTGGQSIVVKFVQAVFDILTALFLYLLLDKVTERTRTLAAALWCFYLPAVLYTNLLITETLFTFLLVISCYIVIRYRLETWISALVIGVILGFIVLIKSGLILFILLFTAVMYFSRIPLLRYKYLAMGTVLVLAPWLVRNYVALGKPTLSTSGGVNLLIGNHPHANGGYTLNFPTEIFSDASSETEADEAAYQYATTYMLDNPGQTVLNGVKKIAHFFSSEGGLLIWSFHDHPEDFSERFALKYASIPIPFIVVINLSYMATLLLGILGFLYAKKDIFWWFGIVFFFCLMTTHVVFYGGFRYHFPLMPFCAIYAAFTLPKVLNIFQELTVVRKIILFVFAFGLLSVWIAELITVINAL